MALCKEYLDPAVYAQQRRITVAGQVLGTYDGKVGEADYTYPLISCEETHVFPSAAAEPSARRYRCHRQEQSQRAGEPPARDRPCPCDPQHGWRCGSARGQMQKLPAGKFHRFLRASSRAIRADRNFFRSRDFPTQTDPESERPRFPKDGPSYMNQYCLSGTMHKNHRHSDRPAGVIMLLSFTVHWKAFEVGPVPFASKEISRSAPRRQISPKNRLRHAAH